MLQLDSIQALGTHWWFEVHDEGAELRHDEIKDLIMAQLSSFESAYSRFLPDSLITQLNETGSVSNPPTELVALLTFGLQLYQKTNGVFNIVSGHQQEQQGYDAEYSFVATDTAPENCIAPEVLKITPEKITLTAGKVDLGGYGKGWMIDQLANTLHDAGFDYFLINGGGDTFGSLPANESHFPITLEHPFVTKTYIGTFSLSNGALASSSPQLRTWKDKEKTYSHLLTLTGRTAVGTFVSAPSATEADAWATILALDPNQACPRPHLIVNEDSTIIRQVDFTF